MGELYELLDKIRIKPGMILAELQLQICLCF
jgi:hypothetical protein